ncbi:MAG: hypothetical protein GOU98_02095 [Candidatus Altiarchaeota archaeon]|nr:hypothetical protein [Candidatus Altiarchaeota archaeon]
MKILDAGVFIEGLMIEGVTTTRVSEEVEVPFGTNIIDPTLASIKLIKEKAKESGDFSVLSSADISILALALELKGTVVTNDFAVQNVASKLKIGWEGSSKSIKREISWVWYCPACFARYKVKKDCDTCGTETKRRPKGKKRVKSNVREGESL